MEGNKQADILADRGAGLAKPPPHLETAENLVRHLAKAVQRMQVHVWAVHQGHIDLCQEDAHELARPDDELYDDYPPFCNSELASLDIDDELMDIAMASEKFDAEDQMWDQFPPADLDDPEMPQEYCEISTGCGTSQGCQPKSSGSELLPSQDAETSNSVESCDNHSHAKQLPQTQLKEARKRFQKAKRFFPMTDTQPGTIKICASLGHTHQFHERHKSK